MAAKLKTITQLEDELYEVVRARRRADQELRRSSAASPFNGSRSARRSSSRSSHRIALRMEYVR